MVKLNKIYTRTGDDGSTGLSDGSRVQKYDPRVDAFGDVDEANAALGVVLVHLDADSPMRDVLVRVQNDLFDLGADLATPFEEAPKFEPLRIAQSQIDALEVEIDRFNADLAPLTSFVLPGGTEVAAFLHHARCVARRAERSIATAHYEKGIDLSPLCLRYLNRLSDLLFVLSRFENQRAGCGDVLWVPGQNRVSG